MSTINSQHYKRVIFLLEIRQQCSLAERAYERLQKCAKAAISLSEYEGEKGAPIEILHLAHSFLTYSAIIAKILFERNRRIGGNRSKEALEALQKRCRDLQELLEIEDSPCLKSLDVRNSLEHIDERLDTCLPQPPFSFEQLAIGGPDGRESNTVTRRFDPEKLEFWFLQDCIQLRPLLEEIKIIQSKVDPAFSKFTNE